MSTTTDSLLHIVFEGYFACRIATDPDPTDEPRGMSGYTLALTKEDPLDQVIRLQIDQKYLEKNAREPLLDMFRNREHLLGVKVRKVTYQGKPWQAGIAALKGLPVNLNGGDAPMKGTIFDSRNIITGNDDAMAFVVYPFDLAIGKRPLQGPSITVADSMNPPHTYDSPADYPDRLSRLATDQDQINEVSEAIGVYDPFGYFLARRRYLEKLIAEAGAKKRTPELDLKIQGWKTRIRQIDFWGDRMNGKLVTRCNWSFDLPGAKTFDVPGIGGKVDTSTPWHTDFWFGGWDGDLLIGYMRGDLAVPFTPG